MRVRSMMVFGVRVLAFETLLLLAWRWIAPAYEAAFRLAVGLSFDLAGLGEAVNFHPRAGVPGSDDTTVAIDLEVCTVWWYGTLDTWYVSFVPTTLLVALVLATPGGWRRVPRRLAIGCAALLLYSSVRVAAVLAKGLIEHLPRCGGEHGGFVTSEAGRHLAVNASALLHEEATVSFLVPLLLWVVVTRPGPELFATPNSIEETGEKSRAGRPWKRTPGPWSGRQVSDYS